MKLGSCGGKIWAQSRLRRRLKHHKFAYLKNSGFARFARGFFIFVHFTAVLVQSTIGSLSKDDSQQ